MAQSPKERSKEEGVRKPPPYPQVEFKTDVEEYLTKCRHCGAVTDLEFLVNEPKAKFPIRFTCDCTNVIKIIWNED